MVALVAVARYRRRLEPWRRGLWTRLFKDASAKQLGL